MNFPRLTILTLAGVMLAGCQFEARLETYPVTVTVTYEDGSPVAGGVVMFQSVDHSVTATGVLDESGKATMETYEPSDGAVAGKHRVAVAARETDNGANSPPKLAPRYLSPDTSRIEVAVEATGDNDLQIQVEPAVQNGSEFLPDL